MVVLGGVFVTGYAAYRLRDTYIGDAAVYLPYARNAAGGNLFQFNPGEFSSGSTSPVWGLVLGIPHLLGLGIGGAKGISALAACAGLLLTAFVGGRFSGSWLAGAAASLLVLGTMTFPSVSMYESGLVVSLSALSLLAGRRVLAKWNEEGEHPLRALAPLICVWAFLPLARPDAVILVAANAAGLLMFSPRGVRAVGPAVLGGLAIAALPAAAYFGYSQVELGTFSTSSRARTFALREGLSKWVGPLYLSGEAVRELLRSPWVFAFVPAVGGIVLAARNSAMRWAAVYAVLAVLGYLALLTFVAPGQYDTPRYLLPLVPLMASAAAYALTALSRAKWKLLAAAVAAVVIGVPALAELRDNLRLARSIGITNHEVFERDVVARVNDLATPGDALLSYEVQTRYYVRDDVLVISQDGITDPRVGPYQERGDMTGFLLRYRPRWWIADRNVTTRRYLTGSVLERALLSFRRGSQPPARKLDGIGFELIARRNRPLAIGFGGWEMLFRLSYPRDRAGQ